MPIAQSRTLIHYKLRRKKVIPYKGHFLKWAFWFEKANRRVTIKKLGKGKNRVVISTAFLGLDYSHGFGDGPLVFETMIFGGRFNYEMRRYKTWSEAVRGHRQMVKLAKAFLNKPPIPYDGPGEEDGPWAEGWSERIGDANSQSDPDKERNG